MTLILTALCKDGVIVCADRRRTIKNEQSVEHFDDLKKIYRFCAFDALAINHGVNRFLGINWDELLRHFENSGLVQDAKFESIVREFVKYGDLIIPKELRRNNFDPSTSFVLCSANEVREATWTRNLPVARNWQHRGLVRSGEGTKYLDDYMRSNPKLNSVDFWQSLSTIEAKPKLIELFEVAILNRTQAGGTEFSDSFDIDSISELRPNSP